MTQIPAPFALRGGLDLATPAIEIPAGRVIGGLNYECVERGYRRIQGHERLDGRTAPSIATYLFTPFELGTAVIAAGATVTGLTSGATGVTLIEAVLVTGDYGAGTAEGYLVLTATSGTFQEGEALQVGGITKSFVQSAPTVRGSPDEDLDNTYYQAAVERARGLIQVVPGSGMVRGVWIFNGVKYAVRDNAGGTAGVLHKSTASGWSPVALGRELAFTSGGTYEIVVGNTITGATSGATAVITEVVLTDGDWTTGDAVGYLYFASQTGNFQAENLNVGANLNVATIAGNSTVNALPAGGRYEFVNENFYGAENRYSMYGVNGVGKAFAFDGTVFMFIHTGMPVDTPNHIAAHSSHLFLAFPGGSLQNSAVANPMVFSAILGASEITLGQEIVALMTDFAQTLTVFGRNRIGVLYGNNVDDFIFKVIAGDAGAIEWTPQLIGYPIYMDDIGLRDMRTTNAFGDFKAGTLTQLIQRLLDKKKREGVTAVSSMRVRAKNQYRLFFSDGTGITMFLGRKYPEHMPFDLGLVARCTCCSEDADGNEILLFGSDDGYVYQMDAGTSLDGEEVQAFLRLAFFHAGTPSQDKRWFSAHLEVDCTPNTELAMLAEFGFGDPNQPPSALQDFDVFGGGGFWDESNWDDFYWDAPVEGTAIAYIDGFGQNCSITILSSAIYQDPHTCHGMTLHYSPRKLRR